MTRIEKLATLNTKYSDLSAKTNDVLDSQAKVNDKITALRAREAEYERKLAEINKYYDAIDEIARLQAIINIEPSI